MTPEPLTKEKIISWDELKGIEKTLNRELSKDKWFFVSDFVAIDSIKSAVEWLLKEIEKKIEEAKKDMEIEEREEDYEMITGYKFRKTAFEEAKNLIKKSFSGVIEE